jgi:myosin heavy subunit
LTLFHSHPLLFPVAVAVAAVAVGINYTHEKLRNYYNFMIFELEQLLFAQEGLRQLLHPTQAMKITGLTAHLDNSNQINFFEHPTSGLFALLNDCMKPTAGEGGVGSGEDQKFLQLLIQQNEKNPCLHPFPASTLASSGDVPGAATGGTTGVDPKSVFVIQHYTIPVRYSVDHIIERNKGIREINFTTLSKKNPKRFYSTDNSHPHFSSSSSSRPSPASTSASASHSSTFSSNLSTLLKKSSMSLSLSSDTKHVSSVQTSIRKKSKTICSVYYSEVCDLIEQKLHGTKSHFILCLKPNNVKAPLCYDLSLMRQQIQSYSIFETSLVTANFISRQLSFPIFFHKYRVLLYPIGVCSFTKPIFEFLKQITMAPNTAESDLATYRSTIISFIDLIPMTHLILAQLYPSEDLPSLGNGNGNGNEKETLQEFYSQALKVGQANSIFLLSNIFEILERLYYLTTDLIARKLQRIWRIMKIQKATAETAGTQSAVLCSLRYFNHFRSQRARAVVVSSILIQRKYRQHALRRRYLSLAASYSRQQKEQKQEQEQEQEQEQQSEEELLVRVARVQNARPEQHQQQHRHQEGRGKQQQELPQQQQEPKKKKELEPQIILTQFSIDLISKQSSPTAQKQSHGTDPGGHGNADSIHYGKRLLHPLNATIAKGSLFGILGGSGSGKVRSINHCLTHCLTSDLTSFLLLPALLVDRPLC